ncbi:hypothetical protein KFK09_024771 [Dendrobium nobile]|uniref:Uncharacterized protein n=1 Tax=Dendrobium nobile TaxID=94219 RepID=A0A8T3AEN4_DENNO|nr:hypothetical protein KFK09_024771 [Dendrobium nobile]
MDCGRRSAVDDDRSRKTRLAVDDDRRQGRWAADDARSRIAFYQAQSKKSLDQVDRNLDRIRETLRSIRRMKMSSATIPRHSSSSIPSSASRKRHPSRHTPTVADDYALLELPLKWRDPPPEYPPLELPLRWRHPPPLQCRTRVPKPPPVPPFASDSKCSFEDDMEQSEAHIVSNGDMNDDEDSSSDLLDRETDADSTAAQLIRTRLECQYSIPLDSQIPDPTHTADTSIPFDHISGITGVNGFADNIQDLAYPESTELPHSRIYSYQTSISSEYSVASFLEGNADDFSDLLYKNLPASQFKKGVEEAMKFLPNEVKLVVDAGDIGVESPHDPKEDLASIEGRFEDASGSVMADTSTCTGGNGGELKPAAMPPTSVMTRHGEIFKTHLLGYPMRYAGKPRSRPFRPRSNPHVQREALQLCIPHGPRSNPHVQREGGLQALHWSCTRALLAVRSDYHPVAQ